MDAPPGSGPRDGQAPPPPTPSNPSPLSTNVSQTQPAVNPEVNSQSAAISSKVPAGSAAPTAPVAQQVAPQPVGPAAKTAARVAAAAARPPADRLTRFRSSAPAQRDMIHVRPMEQFELIEKELQSKIEQIEKLRKDSSQPTEEEIKFHQRGIAKLTRELSTAAGDILKTPQSFQEALKNNQGAALRALKCWVAQECLAASPILSWDIALARLSELIDLPEGNPAVAFVDSLSDLESSHCIHFFEKWAEALAARNPQAASRLICELIRRDVAEETREAQLFRLPTMRTRLYAAYQNIKLMPVMARCLQELTKSLKNRHELVKPNPEAGKPNAPMHLVELKHICQHTHDFLKYLKKELEKPGTVPPDMRDIYRQLAVLLQQKGWGERADIHVNSFLFLRSINPLLTNPTNMPQTDKEKLLSDNVKVIGKALQTVVNNAGENKNRWDDDLARVLKGEKESFSASQQSLLAEIGRLLQR